MWPVNNVIPFVTSYYVKTGRGIKSLFYASTAGYNKPEVDGALLLPLLKPAGVVLRSVTVTVCGLQF